jgi:hypothetical protein
MLKKLILFVTIICLGNVTSIIAQDTIAVKFAVSIPKSSKLNVEQSNELKEKIQMILGRDNVYDASSAYYIVPSIKVLETTVAEGTLRPFATTEGELTLNTCHGEQIINSLTIKLRDTYAADEKTDPTLRLIRAINTKDRRYVRYIRNSQNRITQ